MQREQPSVEVFQNGVAATPPKPSKRLPVFLGVFLVVCLIGLSWNFSRTSIYRTSANLLTVQPQGADQYSRAEDREHVAIQRRVLLGDDVLQTVLVEAGADSNGLPDMAKLRGMLDVEVINGTNLVELSAQGEDPDLLRDLVETWITVYLRVLQEKQTQAVDWTYEELKQQQLALAEKIQLGRDEVHRFRTRHDITTASSEDNEAHARLKGLNQALNKARERLAQARGVLDSHQQMVDEGEVLVPQDEAAGLRKLERDAEQLRAKWEDLLETYTPIYLSRDPKYRDMPATLKGMEAEIATIKSQGRRDVLSQDRAAVRAAASEFQSLKLELDEIKQQTAEFTGRFSELEAMEEDLGELEDLYKENQTRLARLEVEHKRRFPEYQIVDHPFLPQTPIWPDHWRDAGIVAIVALLLGIFAAWLVEYLTRRPEPAAAQPQMTGVHIYADGQSSALPHQHPEDVSLPGMQPAHLPQHNAMNAPLPAPVFEHAQLIDDALLSFAQLSALLRVAPIPVKHCIVLLLHGVNPDELARLGQADVDVMGGFILVPGAGQRMLKMAPGTRRWIGEPGAENAWVPDACNTASLADGMLIAAADAGLPEPAEVTPQAVHQAYIRYLVRQGMRLSDVASIAGPIEQADLAGYAEYSPPGQNRPFNQVDLVHPALSDN